MRYIPQLLVLFAALVNGCSLSAAQDPDVAHGSGTILTVRGPIDPSELGTTLTHEHVFIDFTLPLGDFGRWQLAFRQHPQTAEEIRIWHTPFTDPSQREFMLENLWKNRDSLLLQDADTSVSELREFAQLGGSAVVDVTSIGLGRSPEKLRQASVDSGLHIVMGTGWYQSAWHPEGLSGRSVDELTAEITRDIEHGVGETGIRAGIIGEVSAMYIALEPEESTEAKALRAAARASRMTGAALSVHQWIRDGEMLGLSLQIIEEEGADLRRVILGHIDAVSARNLDRLKALMDRGLTVEFDLFGTPYLLDRPELDNRPMADAIVALVKAGYGDRILMSHDVCTKLQQRAYGGKGFSFIQKQVVPYLLANGLTAEDIHTIQVANPRRLLTIREPRGQL
jgi:phosphotriesterase-related protein